MALRAAESKRVILLACPVHIPLDSELLVLLSAVPESGDAAVPWLGITCRRNATVEDGPYIERSSPDAIVARPSAFAVGHSTGVVGPLPALAGPGGAWSPSTEGEADACTALLALRPMTVSTVSRTGSCPMSVTAWQQPETGRR